MQQADIFKEHLAFIKIDQKDTIQIHQLERQHITDRQVCPDKLRPHNAEPSCQTSGKNKCKKKCSQVEKVLNNQSFFFYKKLYVKDVKINEVLKTKEEKYVGQSHPASKSLNLIIENFYLDLNYTQFSEINFVKYLASQTLQK